MCCLRIVREVALRSTGIYHIPHTSKRTAVDPYTAEYCDFLCSVMRKGDVGERSEGYDAELVGVFGYLVSDELGGVLCLDQGLVIFGEWDAVEFLRVIIEAVAEWIILAQKDALL